MLAIITSVLLISSYLKMIHQHLIVHSSRDFYCHFVTVVHVFNLSLNLFHLEPGLHFTLYFKQSEIVCIL